MPVQPKIERILYATDFLENSRLALDYAVVFAHHFGAVIDIVHVVELSSPAREAEAITAHPSITRQIAQEKLDAIAAGVRRTGVKVSTSVRDGDPCDQVLQALSDCSADLLVIGVHGVHRGLEHLLIGSNTEKILLSAECPVLTVGAHVLAGVDLTLPLQRILYYCDLTPEAATAAPFTCFLSKAFHVPIEVCQVLPKGEERESAIQCRAEDFCSAIGHVAPDSDALWRMPSYQLQRGREAEDLLARAASQHASLITLGAHAETHLGRHLHTSFVYQLLAEATCPVISVLRPTAAKN
jgi:nucleotide-binding universal stress UspA family protein